MCEGLGYAQSARAEALPFGFGMQVPPPPRVGVETYPISTVKLGRMVTVTRVKPQPPRFSQNRLLTCWGREWLQTEI